MSQPYDTQLREMVYSRMAESDDCYLFLYSGLGEKLFFFSVFLEGLRAKITGRLLIDLGMKQYIHNFNAKGSTLIGSLSQIAGKNSLKSFFLRFVHDEIEKMPRTREKAARVVMAIDLSSFFIEGQESNEDDIYSIHKSMMYMTHSLKGVTGVLLYDADCLSESLMSKLIDLHRDSDRPLKGMSNLTALKDEFKVRANSANSTREIVSLGDRILFSDRLSKSAAMLLPNTDAIKDVLPSDPLNVAHRDLAFGNRYTAHEGACPYFSSKVPSGCLLDPTVVRITRVQGRSFIEGHACITSADHFLLEGKPRKNKDNGRKGEDESNHNDNGKETQKDSQPEPVMRSTRSAAPLMLKSVGIARAR